MQRPSQKTSERAYRYVKKHGLFNAEREEFKKCVSRKTKKVYFGTRRRERRYELSVIRTREHCKHETWETSWSCIPGESAMEPDYDYCSECGMKEWEVFGFWGKPRPKKPQNTRERAILRVMGR